MPATCHGRGLLNDAAAYFRDDFLVRTAISQNLAEHCKPFIGLALTGCVDKENRNLLGKLDQARKVGLEVLRLGADQKNGHGRYESGLLAVLAGDCDDVRLRSCHAQLILQGSCEGDYCRYAKLIADNGDVVP